MFKHDMEWNMSMFRRYKNELDETNAGIELAKKMGDEINLKYHLRKKPILESAMKTSMEGYLAARQSQIIMSGIVVGLFIFVIFGLITLAIS